VRDERDRAASVPLDDPLGGRVDAGPDVVEALAVGEAKRARRLEPRGVDVRELGARLLERQPVQRAVVDLGELGQLDELDRAGGGDDLGRLASAPVRARVEAGDT
jgi:hypothetical protein